MPRKSKSSSKSPPNQVLLTSLDVDAPLHPQVNLRRSSRCLLKTIQPEDIARPTRGDMLGIRLEGDEDVDSKEMLERKGAIKEEMQLAIEGLARMERRLRSATKRQKLQIEEDAHYSEPRQAAIEQLSLPDPGSNASLRITKPTTEPEKGGQLPTPDEEHDEAFGKDSSGGTGQDPESRRIDAPAEEAPDVPERSAARPPRVDSANLPLPWKGRLGYACLNTYLRSAKTPVFCSRTCRMASIIDHRYPLQDPSQPEHSVKNRPDKSKEPSTERGDRFVQNLGLTNARDIVRMLRWNDKYGIKFMRLSSEMFPFASHLEHGYKLAPFASKVLAEAGRVAAELGHRLTTHPGQYTQLASPRREVIVAAVRDLEYHDEMLSLLGLPEQQDRDAVMILHMGGVYGDKAATLDRFRKNYAKLSPSVKARLVLENDDVGWSVHDLLPVCEELNIPLVLDYHHHNIIFDSTQCREGTLDISNPELQARIAATWTRKGIRQKMHYSEHCPGAVTPRDRRKHSPRVMTLPPCAPDMDLMIEAKDKEQALFELMRTFKLPGFELANDVIPHEREDEPRPAPAVSKKKQKAAASLKRKRAPDEDPIELNDVGAGADDQEQVVTGREVSDQDYAMGGPNGRVYWPPGNDHWLKPMRKGGAAPLRDELED
ncbi:UV-endonuclease UvdE-domain-containing protein [Chaetomidium leptoderma]|uniref:UV-endonuclease UvdE-domain-containing protein n=1 Tax=Chaetomidium leptoderma TaxID=669021 RepID=A0AAN6ZVL9_9PEZI|nr:UV-endonuclease UvdE-domain-containing protein [Chaetomidium leptoderma]